MSQNKVDLQWKLLGDKKCLIVDFHGKFTSKLADETIQQWYEEFENDKEGGICMIWDCTHMKGWDASSRVKWQKVLKQYKMRIARIWIVTKSPKVKLVTQLMITLTSYPLELVGSREQIQEYVSSKEKA